MAEGGFVGGLLGGEEQGPREGPAETRASAEAFALAVAAEQAKQDAGGARDLIIAPRLLIVVGLTREAALAAPYGRTVIGAAGLARGLTEGTPAGLVSFGLCGALAPGLKVGDVMVAEAVVRGHDRWATDATWTARLRAALPGAAGGAMAAGDAIVGAPAAKAALARATGAVAVDMESHAVAAAAQAAGLPFAVLRVVSDDAGRVLPKAAQAGFKADGEPDIAAVVAALARRPWELPALIRVGLEAEAAFRALATAARALAAMG